MTLVVTEPPTSCGDRAAHDRLLIDQLGDKWTLKVLGTLCTGPRRFNDIRRAVPEISHKSLSQCLRKLERDGLISRTVVNLRPLAVSYEMTALGKSLSAPFDALYAWAQANLTKIEQARAAFDAAPPQASWTSVA